MIAVFGIPAYCIVLCRQYSSKIDIKKALNYSF